MRGLSVTTLRSMVVSAVLAAMGIVVPIGFHMVGLGSKFLPMILVMMLNGFLLPWPWAMLTGALAPIASGLLTGMPPLYPPVFLSMSLELALLSALVAFLFRATAPRIWPAIIGGILFDRLLSLLLTYYLAGWFGLPSKLVSLLALAQGLPGVVLQLAVLPLLLKILQKRKGLLFSYGQRSEAPIFQ